MKAGFVAILGVLALSSPAGASDTPAFVNATMCGAAAPVSADGSVLLRHIKLEKREARPAAPIRRRIPAHARPAPHRAPAPAAPVAEAPAEPEAALRPALHYCVTPDGARGPVQWT